MSADVYEIKRREVTDTKVVKIYCKSFKTEFKVLEKYISNNSRVEFRTICLVASLPPPIKILIKFFDMSINVWYQRKTLSSFFS